MGEFLESDFDRIERYLLNELSAAERLEFEKEIDADSKLEKAVREQEKLITAVKAEGLKADLDSIHSELYTDNTNRNNKPLFFSIAASIAVLIGFSFWFFGQEESQIALFVEYQYTDPGLPVPMSATDNYDFYDAMVYYKQEDYRAAISKWENLLEDEAQNDTLNYYIGASHFNLYEFDQAEPYFEKILDSQESAFVYKAQFMLLLSNLHEGNAEAVQKVTPLKGSPFESEIKAIQEKLKS